MHKHPNNDCNSNKVATPAITYHFQHTINLLKIEKRVGKNEHLTHHQLI